MIGIILVVIVLLLWYFGYVGLLAVAGSVVVGIGSMGALFYDGLNDKLRRALFIILALVGIGMIVWDVAT